MLTAVILIDTNYSLAQIHLFFTCLFIEIKIHRYKKSFLIFKKYFIHDLFNKNIN